MYMQLPDRGNFQRFDLSIDMELAVIPKKIFTGLGKPSWLKHKHHHSNARIRKKLFKAIRENPTNDKNDESNQERLFRIVDGITYSMTSDELVGMDFADYGDPETLLHLRDTFSRYSMVTFIGTKTKTEQTADTVVNAILTNWVSFARTPDIILPDKDSTAIASKVSQFCNVRYITLQKVIPGHRQSLGATESRNMHFKGIKQKILDKRKSRKAASRQGVETVKGS